MTPMGNPVDSITSFHHLGLLGCAGLEVREHGGQEARNIFILRCISLSFGSLSIVAVMVAFYWFVRMRRSFRHDLIMLLIQSDFIKSLWFVIFPIVQFSRGEIPTESTFCQVSGFFLAVGIEASDIAVLLLAVHAALYILRPRRSGGENGLYPYRHIAYAVYVTFPLLIAACAFARGGPAYENVGEYCYLRTDQPWSRMALSWIPRYVIFSVIVVLYSCIYISVNFMIWRYGRKSSVTSRRIHRSCHDADGDVPPLPSIAHHGLIPSTPSSRRASEVEARGRQISVSTTSTIKMDDNPFTEGRDRGVKHQRRQRGQVSIPWNWQPFSQKPPAGDRGGMTDAADPSLSPTSRPVQFPREIYSPVSPDRRMSYNTVSTTASSSRGEPTSFFHRPLFPDEPETGQLQQAGIIEAEPLPPGVIGPVQRGQRHSGVSMFSTLKPNISFPNAFAILCRGLPRGPNDQSSSSSSSVFLSPGGTEGSTGMARQREKIRRQLRLLFIYPLVYMVIWIAPFISHVLGFDDVLTAQDPLWLLVISMISLSIQGAVDSLLFSTRERPWRHVRGGFWEGLKKRFRIEWRWFGSRSAGRSHEEMLVDGRTARARRQVEIAVERRERTDSQSPHAADRKRKGGENWWDAVDVGGAAGLGEEPEGEREMV